MLPHSKLKAVGPTGRSADQGVGRPASGASRPQLLGFGLVWAWPSLNTEVELVLSDLASVLGLHLVHLSLNQYSDIFLCFSVGPKCACNLHISSKAQLAYSRR